MNSSRTSSTPRRHDRRGRLLLWLLPAVLLAALLSICLGSVSVSLSEVIGAFSRREALNAADRIVLYVRLPRTCGALLTGAALATAGCVIQCVLNNPLAAPNIIGVNAGAGLAVAICCAAAPASVAATPAAAFIGALVGVLLVMFIAEKTGASRITLVLAGVAISAIFNAAIDAVITVAPKALNGYSDFRIGGFSNLSMARLTAPAIMIAVVIAALLSLTGELDVLMLGTETAQSLGLPARRLRIVFLALSAALAGASVSIAGILGFVGLLVPHIMRRLVGEETRLLLPACTLGGALLLTLCDLLARTMFAPYELPVGIVMSILGGGFFVRLLLRRKGGRHT